MNILLLEGRTTKDFVKRNDMATTTIAVNKLKSSMFIDVVCFGKVADYCVKNVVKGTRIVVEGELNIYEKDGRKFISCSAKNVVNCGRKETGNEKEQPQFDIYTPDKSDDDVVAINDDDLPF